MAPSCLSPSPCTSLITARRAICSYVWSSMIVSSSRQSRVLFNHCTTSSTGTVTEHGKEWTNKPGSSNHTAVLPPPHQTHQKMAPEKYAEGYALLLQVLDAASLDNFISMIIIVRLLKMQMAQGFLNSSESIYPLKRTRWRWTVGWVPFLSQVSTFKYCKVKWLLWCSSMFSCALY